VSLLTSLRTRIPARIVAGRIFGSKSFPGLTQVLAGRNDGYGVQPLDKLMAVIKWNKRLTRCRTIFVEWNPPADTPLLSETLTRRFPDVKCYVVTPELHRKAADATSRSFLEYLAKNVGIRRAETDWVMAGNTDVILGPDCLLRLKGLEKQEVLRTRRVDIPWEGRPPSFLSLLDGRRYLRFRVIGGPDCSAPGDCTIASHHLWHLCRGYDEAMLNRRVLCDVRGMFQLVAHSGQIKWIGTHFHFDHPESTSQSVTSQHGEQFDPNEGIPYLNPASWGLADATERQIGERIWQLNPNTN
jgi:hypothetical protein